MVKKVKKMILSIILVILIAMVVILSVLKFSGIGERMINNGDVTNEVDDNNSDDDMTNDELMDSFDENRVTSLHSTAKGAANWYDEAVVADVLADFSEHRLTGIDVGNEWVCIGSLVNTQSVEENPDYGGKTLADMAGLSANDVNLNTTNVYNGVESSITSDTCSSIRSTDNGTEVLLVATKGGSFDVESASVVYALSSAEKGIMR